MRLPVILLFLAGAPLEAQAPAPGTDIYLARLVRSQGAVALRNPRNVTRRDGYDNQPAFAPNSRWMYYTSNRGDGQTDIWRFDLNTWGVRRVTRTPESEYSAAITPDGAGLSVVRVERDSAQRLWRFPLGAGRPCLVLEHARPVGYYAWANDSLVAMFVLGTPATLQLGNLNTGTTDTIARAIGRSLHRIPLSQRISFVDKSDSTVWWIRSFDPVTREITPIAPLPPGVEDYVWTTRGELLTSDGQRSILLWNPNAAQPNFAIWRSVGEVDSTVAGRITRLAVSPNGRWVAFVAEPLRPSR